MNGRRMVAVLFLNYHIYYGNDCFCSIKDPIDTTYDIHNGIKRRISITNQYIKNCTKKRGIYCPIYERFCLLNDTELKQYYEQKRFEKLNYLKK